MAKQRSMQSIVNDYKKKEEIVSPKGSEWYNLRPILGFFNWTTFAFLLGGR